MPLLTTTIGAYPKPDYVTVHDWSRSGPGDPTGGDSAAPAQAGSAAEEAFDRATREVIAEQIDAGVDIPTDGEIRREHYIYYQCRHMAGFDFARLTEKVMRTGAWTANVPTVTGPVAAGEPFLPRDFRIAQAATDKPVKITVPGPLTITDSIADEHYGDERKLGAALAVALNAEIRALAEAGCHWIQIDEPLFARFPGKAVDFGIENLERCFHGVPEHVTRVMHMCCGYPNHLDQDDYLKADPAAYFTLADALEKSSTMQVVSIEDAHRYNDLALLDRFKHIKVIFGAVAIAATRIEEVEEIRERLAAALEHIDADRLIAAPDCGLAKLPRETAVAKLRNLCAAARSLG
jgi:5-methyltetrahydropteroyltriglutamate--homocysteine methyltransferase